MIHSNVDYCCSCSNNIFHLYMLANFYVFIAAIATIILVLWLLQTSLASNLIHTLYNCCRLYHNTWTFRPIVVKWLSYSVVCMERHVCGWVGGWVWESGARATFKVISLLCTVLMKNISFIFFFLIFMIKQAVIVTAAKPKSWSYQPDRPGETFQRKQH